MESIFDLNNYKNSLINFSRYEIDNNEKGKNSRREYLACHYSDEFLQKIINDTLNFIITLIENNLDNSHNYVDIDLLEDARYIFLNLSGGWFSDILYSVGSKENKMIISLHLLKCFLGSSFRIEEDHKIEEIVDESNDFDIHNEYWYPFIRIIGSFSSLKEKYEELKKLKQTELIMILSRELTKNK